MFIVLPFDCVVLRVGWERGVFGRLEFQAVELVSTGSEQVLWAFASPGLGPRPSHPPPPALAQLSLKI
jgi:hypothetical protein